VRISSYDTVFTIPEFLKQNRHKSESSTALVIVVLSRLEFGVINCLVLITCLIVDTHEL
jgi:hypothetical protein